LNDEDFIFRRVDLLVNHPDCYFLLNDEDIVLRRVDLLVNHPDCYFLLNDEDIVLPVFSKLPKNKP
jgi:hypothetical protein